MTEYISLDVWDYNFDKSMQFISDHIKQTQRLYFAMDTEYPGLPDGSDVSWDEPNRCNEVYNNHLRRNVRGAYVISLGLSLIDQNQHFPPLNIRFNIQWDRSNERQAPSSIKFLEDKGVDLSYYREYGILKDKFGSQLFSNEGLMGNPDFKWLTFQGLFDFAYLIKLASGLEIPETLQGFKDTLKLYFPNYIDMKYLVQNHPHFKNHVRGGLQYLCEKKKLEEIEDLHSNPSSDAYLTWLLHRYCVQNNLIHPELNNRLWSLDDILTDMEKNNMTLLI